MGLADEIRREYETVARAEHSAERAGSVGVGPGQVDRLTANHEAIVVLAEQLDGLVDALRRANSGRTRIDI